MVTCTILSLAVRCDATDLMTLCFANYLAHKGKGDNRPYTNLILLKSTATKLEFNHKSSIVSPDKTLIQTSHLSLQNPENMLKPKTHIKQRRKKVFIFLKDTVAK